MPKKLVLFTPQQYRKWAEFTERLLEELPVLNFEATGAYGARAHKVIMRLWAAAYAWKRFQDAQRAQGAENLCPDAPWDLTEDED